MKFWGTPWGGLDKMFLHIAHLSPSWWCCCECYETFRIWSLAGGNAPLGELSSFFSLCSVEVQSLSFCLLLPYLSPWYGHLGLWSHT